MKWLRSIAAAFVLAASCTALSPSAQAMPLFHRQTGQSCVACHAGGQFPVASENLPAKDEIAAPALPDTQQFPS